MANHFGANESFAELAMPHFARVYNFAYWVTLDRSAAENLVLETYTKAQNGLSTYQQGANFRAWIYRILRHTFLTTQAGLRASSNVMPQAMESHDSDGGRHPQVLLAHIDQERLRECLQELPMGLREVLLLCDLEEMNYKEMAQILGIPAGSVMARLNRARAAMRTLLTSPRPAPTAVGQTQQYAPPPEDDIPEMPEEPESDEIYEEIEDEGKGVSE